MDGDRAVVNQIVSTSTNASVFVFVYQSSINEEVNGAHKTKNKTKKISSVFKSNYGACSAKHLRIIIVTVSSKDSVFSTAIHFHLSLIFGSKSRSLPLEWSS